MTDNTRLRAIQAELRSLTVTALKAHRDFTPSEQDRFASLIEEGESIRTAREKAGTRKFQAELEAFLAEGGGGHDDGGYQPLTKSRGSWSDAMLEQQPGVVRAGGKAITLPPTTSFVAPLPAPIVTDNAPVGSLMQVVSAVALTEGSGVSFLRAGTRVTASTVVAPGAVKPTRDLTLEKVDSLARTIAVLAPGIRKQDVADIRDLIRWIDFELRVDVLSTLDWQMLLGTGEGEDFEGMFYLDGVQVQDFTDSASASIRRAAAKIEAKGYRNSAIILNPVDYAELELELGTAGGEYRGNFRPVNPTPRTIWGIPVASVAAAPLGLAVVGDLRQAWLWMREDIEVTITETNSDDFAKNLFTARAEMRAAFGVQSPLALALVKLNDEVLLPTEDEESL
jgi:Phage capsid family.